MKNRFVEHLSSTMSRLWDIFPKRVFVQFPLCAADPVVDALGSCRHNPKVGECLPHPNRMWPSLAKIRPFFWSSRAQTCPSARLGAEDHRVVVHALGVGALPGGKVRPRVARGRAKPREARGEMRSGRHNFNSLCSGTCEGPKVLPSMAPERASSTQPSAVRFPCRYVAL